MVTERYAELDIYTTPEYGVAKSFFDKGEDESSSCIFLVSCADNERVLYVEDTFADLTGYAAENFIKGGLHFWFPLVHPDDLHYVTSVFADAQKKIAQPNFVKEEIFPFSAEYRVRQPDGSWKLLRDTKYLLFPWNNAEVDKVLCKLEVVNTNAHENSQACSRMDQISRSVVASRTTNAAAIAKLTAREKEILILIGEGLSSKMIADKCNISINTVETHRRHLLEKLGVKNSMELVKEASRILWP